VGQLFACARPAVPRAPEAALVLPPLGAAPAASAGDRPGVVFAHAPAVVGARYRVEVHATSESGDIAAAVQRSAYDSVFDAEVLAVDGPAPSRVRLSFSKNAHTYASTTKPTVLEGKTFVVDARAPHVRQPDDREASEEETSRVLDVFPEPGTRARLDEVLPDAPMQVGETRDAVAAAILRIVHPRAWSLTEGTATLVGTEAGNAIFRVELDATSTSGLHMRVAGEARIRLTDARLVLLSLRGGYEEPPDPAARAPGRFELVRRTTDAPLTSER